jgi:hypothetical protein
MTETCQVYYRPSYKWYYLSNQQVDELLVFKQSDSLEGASPGMWFPSEKRTSRLITIRSTTCVIL